MKGVFDHQDYLNNLICAWTVHGVSVNTNDIML